MNEGEREKGRMKEEMKEEVKEEGVGEKKRKKEEFVSLKVLTM